MFAVIYVVIQVDYYRGFGVTVKKRNIHSVLDGVSMDVRAWLGGFFFFF